MNWDRFANAQVVLLFIALTMAGSLLYLRRYRIERPPIGVFTRVDAIAMMISVVVVTVGYSRLPRLAAMAILGLVYVGILHFTLRPALSGTRASRLTLVLVGVLLFADILLWTLPGEAGGPHQAFSLYNNLLITLAMVGVVNMYVQTGITTHHVAGLAVALIAIDYTLTEALPYMVEMFERLNDVPFIPALQWGGAVQGAGIPIGDVIIVVMWTLVAFRSYGAPVGRWVAGSMILVVMAAFAAVFSGIITRKVPVMVPVGLVIAVEYLWLQRRFGSGGFPEGRDVAAAADPGAAEARLETLVARTLDAKEARRV